ncbi:MAG: O-antigen ligase family protein [Flavobacteriales bacterium]|nr:O-antigen ligase family protein [Flavobacteriales bacterium]
MQFSDWHKASTWQERSALLGRCALLLAIAALPVHGPLVPIPLALGIVLLLPQVLAFGSVKDKGLLLLPVVFYLLHVLGMAWTTDVAFGLFDLEVKLSLLLVPLLAAGMRSAVGRDMLRSAMTALSVGLLVAMVISAWTASTCYSEHGWKECFTQSYLSTLVHPSYMAWFACWALFYWGSELVTGKVTGLWMRSACILFLVLLIVYVVMLASKSGLIGLAIVLFLLVTASLRIVPKQRRWLLIPSLVILLGVPGSMFSRVLSVRVNEAIQAIERLLGKDSSYLAAESSSDERLVAWSCSVHCMAMSPWGAGTGDIKHALLACYQEKGATAAIQHKLNSHSQVLQSGVALGWPGLLLVCAMMVAPLVIGIRRKDPFIAIFALLYIINGAIESVLEVQAGVVFFILFFVLLICRSPEPAANTEQRP